VDFVYPDVEYDHAHRGVRIMLDKPGGTVSPGMFVRVALKMPMGVQPGDSGQRRSADRGPADLFSWIAATAYLEPRRWN
jgi:hypothetical protein